ncbi:MAG TPA: hypothetical protein HA360_00490 [Nanoarchaeota archaeon]|nr:hypothetical protein [Nanoarchaeota archaeon]HIJ05337.1 hypothetical protein [Nanoarchaeota archaeon]
MKEKIRELGLAGLGLAVTVKDKARSIGRKLIRKGEANEKILSHSKQKFVAGAHFAGKEALVISRKSLQMLERELKKLEVEARKAEKVIKKTIRKPARKKAKKRL